MYAEAAELSFIARSPGSGCGAHSSAAPHQQAPLQAWKSSSKVPVQTPALPPQCSQSGLGRVDIYFALPCVTHFSQDVLSSDLSCIVQNRHWVHRVGTTEAQLSLLQVSVPSKQLTLLFWGKIDKVSFKVRYFVCSAIDPNLLPLRFPGSVTAIFTFASER